MAEKEDSTLVELPLTRFQACTFNRSVISPQSTNDDIEYLFLVKLKVLELVLYITEINKEYREIIMAQQLIMPFSRRLVQFACPGRKSTV